MNSYMIRITAFLRDRKRLLPLLILGGAMAFVFGSVLPWMSVDRLQEGIYLGRPYGQLFNQITIMMDDPFLEHGLYAYFVPAFLLKTIKTLLIVRWYNFSWCILAVILIFLLFRQYSKSSVFESKYGIFLSLLISLTMWLSIPLSIQYPSQTNGMMEGLSFFVLGLLVIKKKPHWAVFCFGTAAYSKGQFLAFFIPIMCYLFLIHHADKSWGKRFLQIPIDFLIFFSPGIIVSFLVLPLGWFHDSAIFYRYIMKDINMVIGHIRGIGSGPGTSEGFRFLPHLRGGGVVGDEISRWGFLSWVQILFCFTFSLWISLRSLYLSIRKEKHVNALALMGFCGCFYILVILQIYKFPYWYNFLVVLFFNIAYVLYLVDLLLHELEKRKRTRLLKITSYAMAAFFCDVLFKSIFEVSPFRGQSQWK